MAFPKILQKLFANNGAGPKLREDVVPDNVLLKKGGNVTGYIQLVNGNNARIQSSTDDSFTAVLGSSGWSKGGRVVTYGKDNADFPGCVLVVASDGTNQKTLSLKPNGEMLWVGKTVLTSDNGLPLSGGTMTGTIKFTSGQTTICKNVNNGQTIIRGGGDGYAFGANICLNGKEYSGASGDFSLTAHDGTNGKELRGKAGGSLKWAGNEVITAAGGTITGEFKTSATDFVKKTNDTGHLTLIGASAWDKGAAIRLNGGSESGTPGWFELIAHNGSTGKTLQGKPDGTLTWNGQNVITNNWTNAWVINRDSGHIHKSNNTGNMMIRGGGSADSNGAKLQLYGSENATKGDFILMAHNGTTGQSLRGKADGNLTWPGTFSSATVKATSDSRLKSDITPFTADLSSLGTYHYTLDSDKKKHVGLIAQEVMKVIPEAVSENDEGFYSLDYNAVVAVLVAEVNALKKRVAELEA